MPFFLSKTIFGVSSAPSIFKISIRLLKLTGTINYTIAFAGISIKEKTTTIDKRVVIIQEVKVSDFVNKLPGQVRNVPFNRSGLLFLVGVKMLFY